MAFLDFVLAEIKIGLTKHYSPKDFHEYRPRSIAVPFTANFYSLQISGIYLFIEMSAQGNNSCVIKFRRNK